MKVYLYMNMDDLLVGFRFYPTEEELVSFYLLNKLNGTRCNQIDRVIPIVNVYDYNPWDLPLLAGEGCPADTEQWFFFTARQESEARGGRINRLTENGYWKATGSPGDVYSSQNLRIGRKKTMVFYVGRAPNGRKTEWKMHEFKAFDTDHQSADANQELKGELSLCRIYKKTKSMRGAFDRRPPIKAAASDELEAAVHHHHPSEAMTIQQINPAMVHVESSSSGDHDITINNIPNSHSLESENIFHMAINDQPLLDWEDYFWFNI